MKTKFLTLGLLLLLLKINAQPASGLVAYWKFDGNLNDAGSNAIHGTNFGATATANYSGALNCAMNFSNTTSTVTQYATHPVNANVNFSTTQNFSIDFFVYYNTITNAGGIYDNCLNYGGAGVWLWNGAGFNTVQFNFRNGSVGTTNGAISPGVWKHITAVRSGTTISIYVNGVLNASGNAGTMVPAYSFPARIGTMFYNGNTPPQYNGLNGKIDELRIYNRALTQAEINQLQLLLPVSLTGFSAQYHNNQTLLKWQTTEEYNSKNFIVQRSADGTNFENITTIAAAGNSNIIRNYQYNDNLIAYDKDKVYYRLQQNDMDGNVTYSKVIQIRKNKAIENLLVYPNPVTTEMQIQAYFSSAGNATIALMNAEGRLILQKKITVQQGSNITQLLVAGLPKGNYTLRIQSLTEMYNQKIIKL